MLREVKRRIPVSELRFGMYVAELDRPWTDTPFMFQGFMLSTQQRLDALKKYCSTVIIDPERSAAVEAPALRIGKTLDAQRLNAAVTSMTQSVLRNPDALLLFSQLRTKGEYTESHALDVSIYMITFGRFLQLEPG